jgi:hypothetical protein
MVKQQADDIREASRRGVGQRRAPSGVIALVPADFIRRRGILPQQFVNARDVAGSLPGAVAGGEVDLFRPAIRSNAGPDRFTRGVGWRRRGRSRT